MCRIALLLACALLPVSVASADPTVGDPAEILLGNRLFDESRFAQYFWAHAPGDVNAPLPAGDPVVAHSVTTGTPLPGPFAGESINCRVCHMDIEHKGVPGGGGRNYSDFARRSPIPARDDGQTLTVRNAQQLINASLPRANAFALHFDGEFATVEALVKTTLTGRNFGWYPDERPLALTHLARVIREDDGSGRLAQAFGGGSYAGIFAGYDSLLPRQEPIPVSRQLDVDRASDEQLLQVVAEFIADYVRSLTASQDEDGAFNLSPYDVFLRKNDLPVGPRRDETAVRYARRLARRVARLRAPVFVDEADGRFELHDQAFRFGPEELAGLRTFLARPKKGAGRHGRARGGAGNCAACHPPPVFSDFAFHNTGVSQREYDTLHGEGAFAALFVPYLATRNADPGTWLPPSAAHPRAPSPFRAVPSADRAGVTDLGLWNVYANPDVGDAQREAALRAAICTSLGRRDCRRRSPARLLEAAIALFKTPGLRDLSHADPYLHDGSRDTLADVVRFYVDSATLARAGRLRNGSAELREMALTEADVGPLAAFLHALNEDFE